MGWPTQASARRLSSRVSTPLASTAIIHLITSFRKHCLTWPSSRCQPERTRLRAEVLSRRVSRPGDDIIVKGQDDCKTDQVRAGSSKPIRLFRKCGSTEPEIATTRPPTLVKPRTPAAVCNGLVNQGVLRKCNVCGVESAGKAIWRKCPIMGRAKVVIFEGFFHNCLKSCLGLYSVDIFVRGSVFSFETHGRWPHNCRPWDFPPVRSRLIIVRVALEPRAGEKIDLPVRLLRSTMVQQGTP